MYQNPDSFSDVKVSNENVALIDHQISRNNIMSNDGFTPLFITDYFPTSEQYYLDVVNGIATIQANCEIKEVQVIINGITKYYKLIPDEEIATTNDSVQQLLMILCNLVLNQNQNIDIKDVHLVKKRKDIIKSMEIDSFMETRVVVMKLLKKF